MTPRLLALLGLLLALPAATAAQAAAVSLTDQAMTRLGVVVSRPVPDDGAVIAAGQGYVVAPPASDQVVSARSSGLVTEILVASGETVTVGTPLARLTGNGFLELQRAYLSACRAENLANAQQGRNEALLQDGIISERRLAESASALAAARLHREQLRLQLEYAGLDNAAIDDLRRGERLNPSQTLKAPRAGTVVAVYVSPGERVEPDGPVLRLVNLRRLWLELHLPLNPETRERTVRAGMPARLTGADVIIGRVTAVAPMVDAETQTFLVRVELTRDAPLALGAFVSAELLDMSTIGGRLRIPAGALIRDAAGTRVFLRRGDTLSVQAVELVGESAAHVWVTGLAGDDLVVTEGLAALRALWADLGGGS